MGYGKTRVLLLPCATALAAGWLAFAQPGRNATKADFERLMTELSNWGRWGKDDQMGAVNLITPEKRKQALRTVKEGASFSMARNAEFEKAVDNTTPIERKMTRTGVVDAKKGPPETGGSGD